MKAERVYLILVLLVLMVIVLGVGSYVRSGGSEIFAATSIAALPAGYVLVLTTYALRKSNAKILLVWCILAMVMIRSVQVWKTGIDFRDELRFIDYSKALFEQGQFLGYLRYYPANIPFAAVFYSLYSIWHNTEVFEVVALIVYPILVFGYLYMTRQIERLSHYKDSVSPLIPAVMFLPFIPTFSILPTYYWPQLLGLGVLFFAFGSVLKLASSESTQTRRALILTIGLSILLVFSHSVSSALYLLTVPFIYLAVSDKSKKRMLLFIEIFTLLLFVAVHYSQYWSTWVQIGRALLGDALAWQRLERYSFPDLGSVGRSSIFMTVAHTGFFVVVGVFVLWRLLRTIRSDFGARSPSSWMLTRTLRSLLSPLRKDPISTAFVGLGVLAFLSAAFIGGNFLDPVRIIGWIALLALPIIIPKNKVGAIVLVVVLVALFFLLVWTVNSPWGSPIGSSVNLNTG